MAFTEEDLTLGENIKSDIDAVTKLLDEYPDAPVGGKWPVHELLKLAAKINGMPLKQSSTIDAIQTVCATFYTGLHTALGTQQTSLETDFAAIGEEEG